jgi:hypothetical protein
VLPPDRILTPGNYYYQLHEFVPCRTVKIGAAEKAKRYTEIPELTGELLHLFIERIEVGEREERYSRTAEQKIIIHYRDIGVLGAFAEEAQKIAV